MNKLTLADEAQIGNELIVTTNEDITHPELEAKARTVVTNLVNLDIRDIANSQHQAQTIASIGNSVTRQIAHQSTLLKQPLANLLRDAEDGSPVANSLLALQGQVNAINPNHVNFSMGSFRRMLARIPGVGTPVARWFARYQSVDNVIGDIVNSLKDGKAQLERDNVTLRTDQVRMRELTFQLQDYIKFGQILDQILSEQVGNTSDSERRKFLEEDVLFPLRQRIMDLQQTLAVNQQGLLSTEVIIRNNQELVRGVDRAVNVTVTALSTASTLALALQAQKRVLKGVQSVTDTTNELIAGTAKTLRTQGVEIQKQATGTQLDLNTLKQAFVDVEAALQDIGNFRRQALPKMMQSIEEMDELTQKMDSSVQRVSHAEGAQSVLDDVIDLIDARPA
ncbi:toxic anion resistance protein [Marinobacter nauticus]|uniref:Toxic anion resistance protein n=1 Tax=Marinobacter nauticus TaxID=2743 RepID=A0A1M2UUE8_MARNT|nr:toxic anion resistance protein [Marinobacter nauticus]OJS98936.1 toxic anion resistance protein [Marinobacter nauticus]